MIYTGTEAEDLTYHAGAYAPQVAPRPAFEVVEGAGLDARARQGVSLQFFNRIKLVVFIGIMVALAFMIRVAVSVATVSQLSLNQDLRSQVNAAVQLERDLKVTTSTLSSASRIDSIAQQTYGMVRAENTEVLSINGGSSYTVASAVAANDDSKASETETDKTGTSEKLNNNSTSPAELEEGASSSASAARN